MIRALRGYVIIKPIEDEVETKSGIVLPDTSKDRPVKGEVLDVGEETATEGKPVKIGDIVYYRKYGGEEIKRGAEVIRIVKFSEVIAIDE